MAQKLTPREKQIACETAMNVAAELINEVCGSEGSRIVKINSDAASISFAVPPEVMDKINGNPGITVDDLMALPWSRGWSEGMLKMVYPDWPALP
ncbi:unnamed protein product, partial [marine sediment metagenome]